MFLGLVFPFSFLLASLHFLYLLSYWLRFGMDHFLNVLPPLLEQFFRLALLLGLVGIILVLITLLVYYFKKRELPFNSFFMWCREQIFLLLFFVGCVIFLTSSLGVIHAELIIWNPHKNRCLIKVGGLILERKVQYLGACGEISYFFDRVSPSKVMAVQTNKIGFLRFL